MKRNKLLLLLVLLAAVATGAWATDYTTLAVGDVIKVGDTFTPTADGAFYNEFGFSSGETYTLIRADVDDGYNVTEKTDGAYYVFKYVSIMNPYIHFEKDFAVTAISDGLEVTKIETIKGMPFYTLALHESAAPAPAAIFAIDTDGTTQDFGSVEADATAQKTFTITNSGNKPLYVTISNPADFTAEMTPNDNANVYFTDALGWGDIRVYYWPNGPEWPGVAMTELYTNELGQKVYCYKLPADIEGVIFNGNGNQTGDINGAIGKAYYTTGEKNSIYFTVGTWSYNNCVPAGMSRVLTVTMNTATLGSKSGNITLSFDAKNATSFTIPCTGKTVTYYNVTMADGTEDADKWTISPKQGLSEGDQVTVTYTGEKRVKSVKAVKKVAGPSLNITSPTVGQVIGSDGKNYAAASVPSGVDKVAMIAYVSGSNGLAIALADEGSLKWATAISTCEAKTPAFTNGTWKLPSQDEWKQMFIANGGNEDSYDGLNTAITTAGGTAFQDGTVDYWSSSEYNSDKANLAQFYYGYPLWFSDWKTNAQWVRACLAF